MATVEVPMTTEAGVNAKPQVAAPPWLRSQRRSRRFESAHLHFASVQVTHYATFRRRSDAAAAGQPRATYVPLRTGSLVALLLLGPRFPDELAERASDSLICLVEDS